jgi:small subunit ribosomal protein S25e
MFISRIQATLFRPDSYLKFLSEVPKGRVITPAAVSDKFKINASLARKALKDMARQKLIARVVSHSSLYLYTRTAEQIKQADEKAAQAAKLEADQAAKKAAKAAPKETAKAPAKGAKKGEEEEK